MDTGSIFLPHKPKVLSNGAAKLGSLLFCVLVFSIKFLVLFQINTNSNHDFVSNPLATL